MSCRHSHYSTCLTALSVWQARLLRCFINLGNRWKSDCANDNYRVDGEESPNVICPRDVIVAWKMCVCDIRLLLRTALFLGYYAVSCGTFLPTFRDNLSVSSLGFQESKRIQNGSWTLNMGPIACPETVINYHNLLRNNPDEHSSQCVCGVAHNQYSLSQQSRSLVANSLRESTYCALTRTSIGCCTTMCRVNQNGPMLVQKDNCHYFFSVGWGVLTLSSPN